MGQHGHLHQHHRVLHGIGVFAGYNEPTASFRNFGFLLNNELTDFNTAPIDQPVHRHPRLQRRAADKRPRSSMNPTMIFTPDGRPLVAFGSPGGATIINSVLNVTLNLIDHKMRCRTRSTRRASRSPAPRGDLARARFPAGDARRPARAGLHRRPPPTSARCRRWRSTTQTGKQYGAADARREGTVIGLPRPRGK